MAIIQMSNNQVLDVQESGEDIYGEIIRCPHSVPVIPLTIIDEQGGGSVWINAAEISSFVGTKAGAAFTD